MNVMVRVRNLANWCNLSTPLGLLVARLGGARVARGANGTWLADGYRSSFPVAGAFAVGSVLITAHPSWERLEAARPGTLAHEENHSWQWAYMLGLPFLPAYAASMGWSWLRTGDRASGNFFERAADLELGGYVEAQARPFSAALADLRGRARGLSGIRAGRAATPNGHRDASHADDAGA
ncbi:hypothetical protein [Aestuariimicrobium ganziense]|uniref:hypothetical protein n=1 Tax=Aestuariimicrobium ganziense TaxID=2773677 RepID=UPI0019410A87|nr:hypothetical protein [Aestuariimicrobium ganziense]